MEENHIHSTPSSHCCHCNPSLSLFTLYMSHNSLHLALFACLFYRQIDELSSLISSSCTWDFTICQWWVQLPLTNGNPTLYRVGAHLMTNPNNNRLPFCSSVLCPKPFYTIVAIFERGLGIKDQAKVLTLSIPALSGLSKTHSYAHA